LTKNPPNAVPHPGRAMMRRLRHYERAPTNVGHVTAR
jgi:hypothetical protein